MARSILGACSWSGGWICLHQGKTLDTELQSPILCTEAMPDVGCFALHCIVQVKSGADDRSVLEYTHALYQDLGIQDLTVQTDES